MKQLFLVLAAFLFLSISNIIVPIDKTYAQGAEVSFQIFYDQLSPYGNWVDFRDEGYVWVPTVAPDFSPYSTNGYWVYTDYGWTWVSNYRWGWAPFHYGRWDFDDDYGWYWTPEYEWAPAWVAWSRSPGYYGWAPLRPGIDVNASITEGYYLPPEHWHFVHEEYLGRRDIGRYYAPRTENTERIRSSTMIGKTYIDNSRHTIYPGGPQREDVQKSTKTAVVPLRIAQRATPGQTVTKNQVSIYRPVVAQTTPSNPKPAPPKVTNLRDLKPIAGRTPSQERLNTTSAAPAPSVQAKNNEPRNIPSTPPQQEKVNAQPPAARANQNAVPQSRQQPSPQQTAPKVNTPPPATQQNNRVPEPRQQPPPQQQAASKENAPQPMAAPRQRAPRYAPPKYESPKPNAQPQRETPPVRTMTPRAAPPRNAQPAPPRQPNVQPRQAPRPPSAPPHGKTPH